MVAFQELLFLCALQLLLGPGGVEPWGRQALLVTCADQGSRDGDGTHVPQAPPSGQACAKHCTHPHVVPRPSQETCLLFSFHRGGSEKKSLSPGWEKPQI